MNKDRLAAVFGQTLGLALFIFALLSFPLAVYAVNGFLQIGILWSVLAVIVLYAIVPFGELVALVLAVAGAIDLLFY